MPKRLSLTRREASFLSSDKLMELKISQDNSVLTILNMVLKWVYLTWKYGVKPSGDPKRGDKNGKSQK